MNATWRVVSLLTSIVNRVIVLALAGGVVFELVRDPVPGGLGSSGSPGAFAWLETWVLGEPMLAITAAVVLVVLNLNMVQFSIYSLSTTPDAAFITSQTQGGRSRIALTAIQRALRVSAAQIGEIARVRIRVLRSGKHRFRVHVRYRVLDVKNAGSAAGHLRLVLKKRFSDLVILDPKDKVEFDLDLAGIVRSGKAPPVPKKLPAPPDVVLGASFKGPVYPVEGEVT